MFFLSLGLLSACGSSTDEDVENAVRHEKVVPVQVESVILKDLSETFTLPANLEALEDLILTAETVGVVKKIHFQEGDKINTGDTLLDIDPETIMNLLNREQHNVAVITKKVMRYQQLQQDGLISEQALDDMENNLTIAQASLHDIKLRMAKSFPQAPISGIVDRLYIDRGEYVNPGKPLVRLLQVDKLKVLADVPEKDVPFLQVGQLIEIIPAVFNNRSISSEVGVIEYISFAAHDITKTYRTKVIIDNSSNALRPGMIVRAKFKRQELLQAIAVPMYAVLERNGEKIVFVAESGIARKVKVVLGSTIGQLIVIESGLALNQAIIVSGQQLLVDGAKITVENK